MNRPPLPHDDSWESDSVWKLLDQAPPSGAGLRFADDTLRAARLMVVRRSWWRRLCSPIPLAGLSAATAALVLAAISLAPAPFKSQPSIAVTNADAFADIQKLAETEVLRAAVDHLDDFTDTELACLIGF